MPCLLLWIYANDFNTLSTPSPIISILYVPPPPDTIPAHLKMIVFIIWLALILVLAMVTEIQQKWESYVDCNL
jgi:hypothetical protein